MFYLLIVFLPVAIIFCLLTYAITIYFRRSAIPFAELEDENEEEEHIEIEATGVRSSSAKKAKRQDQKQKYKEYKQHLIQKQKLEQERQDMLIQEKRLVENKLTKFDNEWFKETENDRKLVEIEVEIKGDMNNIVSYIQRRDIVYFEELEILFFHSKSEISKMVDLWISTGVILASRNDNIITIL